ncbi:HD-GYP domain-containing protein [Vallitalea guaymasensis]|uniref:HD domain-containing protein n=1 Tax=Vallitalea guaymasensis TaxID=1185412 RepID=A0A8J8SER1_9FIRM|nr:HD domain-containing protein [Vallitalea guaymasensis]
MYTFIEGGININYKKQEIQNTINLINQHGKRVGILAFNLSKQLELPDKYWFLNYIAGRWHDFGKLAIPIYILNKPAKLNSVECEIMKKHPIYSYALVDMCGFGMYTKKAILYHHEDYCGSGYPFGLSKKDIPLPSRILRICDVYDALTEDRVYRPRFSCQSALSLMDKDCDNGKLDYHIYSVFKSMMISKPFNTVSQIYKAGSW